MRLSAQRGFAPIIVLLAILIGSIGAIVVSRTIQHFQDQKQTVASPSPSAEASSSATLSPKPTAAASALKVASPSPTVTKSPSPTPSTISTQTTSSSGCSYDTSSPSGAVKVEIKPNSGQVVGDQTVELQAKSGCKVLDGKSTDKLTLIARAGGNGYSSLNTVSFSTVAAGSYSVRIQYKGQWTGYTGVDVSSGQLKTVEIKVDGENAPAASTAAANPKPICSVLIMPSASGTAPYSASVCVGNNSSPSQNADQEYVDYDGNGSWDYQGATYGCHAYTFQTPGSYTPKAKLHSASGGDSDTCQATVTVN